MIQEIIVRSSGNCLVGNTAQHALRTPIPAVFGLDGSEKFHVFEWDGKAWIHRAAQSSWSLASKYCTTENHVLVHREDDTPPETGVLSIGNDFVDENGIRHTSVQLCRGRHAVASVDYKDAKVVRFIKQADVCGGTFLANALAMLNNSIPVTFQTQALA